VASLTWWALALVASNTTSTSSNASSSSSPSTPPAVTATSRADARARPSLAGSIPAIAAMSSTVERRSFVIRSVPMLPEPMIAARCRRVTRRPFARSRSQLVSA
jgi:hypothetical protein